MDIGRILKAGLAAGVVANVYDYVANTYVFTAAMSLPLVKPAAEMSMPALIVLDLVVGIVAAFVYSRVRSSFAAGAKGGAEFGFYAGLLVHFPLWIGMHLYLVGFPYGVAWQFTISGILASVIIGAVIGATWGAPAAAST